MSPQYTLKPSWGFTALAVREALAKGRVPMTSLGFI